MAFQQGLSGLSASARNLDVIGHNIANSNTTGFKSSRTEFSAMVASAIGTVGGLDSGIGVEIGAVAQQFTQGNFSVTGNNLDVAINGNGFFRLQMPDGSPAYTRAGDFKLNTQGNLVTNSGAKVMGYLPDPQSGKIQLSGAPQPVSFPTNALIPAKETTSITATMNLDARATDAAASTPRTPRSTYGTSINVYDSQGVATPVNLYFEKNGSNTWDVFTSLDTSATRIGSIEFDGEGKFVSTTPEGASGPGPLVLTDIASANPNSPPGPGGPQPVQREVALDFSGTTQFGTKFSVSDLKQDGYATGQLTGINISDDGTILARFSNGMTRTEGQLALANFRNTQGLAAVGGNAWVETHESGPANPGVPGDGNFGALRSGALEDSNVDLTAELVNMMTAQRAYQANAQTIKTQDQVMSTLINLR
ncbi:flagellar hook protein FlgE [Melaminivora sp.]|uniref:flagellar hook protein FlgE n=1 Tax=Melaminivora sp. TaxID=1933032 RepID=UPI0028ACDACC|nr:flagellar hook protein FlgE [Melaminivora sp.]